MGILKYLKKSHQWIHVNALSVPPVPLNVRTGLPLASEAYRQTWYSARRCYHRLKTAHLNLSSMLLIMLAVSSPALGQTTPDFTMRIDGNFMTLSASNARLSDILREIERQSGILMKFAEDVSERITIEFSNESLERVIPRLAPSHLLVHEGGSRGDSRQFIKEVLIISDDPNLPQVGNSSYGNLPTGEPAEEIVVQGDQSQEQFNEKNIEEQQPATE